MNCKSGSPKKASLAPFHDCRAALGGAEGGITMFDQLTGRQGRCGSGSAIVTLATAATIPVGAKGAIEPITWALKFKRISINGVG